MLQLHVLQLFYFNFSVFGAVSPTSPQIRYSLLKCFFTDFLFTFPLAYIPNLGPVGTRPVTILLCANLQFCANFSQFLPRDPGCAALRCTFISQIFYVFYFILLARILDTLDQRRLHFSLMPVCSFMLWTFQCSPPIQCPAFNDLSFFTWMCYNPWLLWLR